MSELLMRNLAAQAARHPRIESAIMGAIRDTLPDVINDLLREGFAGETLRLYVPKHGREEKKSRDEHIRARFNGKNAGVLSRQFGISESQVRRIVSVGRR